MNGPYKRCCYSVGHRVELIPNQYCFGGKIDIEEVVDFLCLNMAIPTFGLVQ